MSHRDDFKNIIQTLERPGGWNIAAIKIRGLLEDYDSVVKERDELRKDWGEAERRLHDKFAGALLERDEAKMEVERLNEILQRYSTSEILMSAVAEREAAKAERDALAAELAEWKSDCAHVHKVEDETIARLKAEVLSISNERNLAFEAFNVEKARHAEELRELVGAAEKACMDKELIYEDFNGTLDALRNILNKFKGDKK